MFNKSDKQNNETNYVKNIFYNKKYEILKLDC